MPGYDTLNAIVLWLRERQKHYYEELEQHDDSAIIADRRGRIAELDDLIGDLKKEQKRQAR